MRKRGRTRSAVRGVGALVVMLAMVLMAGCQADSGSGSPIQANANPGKGAATPKKTVAPTKVTVSPADRAENVAVDAPVTVTAGGGSLTQVEVTNDGKPVEGTLNTAKTSWSVAQGSLLPDRVYQVHAVAKNADGQETQTNQTFTTAKPAKVLGTSIEPLDGSTVGVGMPIVIKFTVPVKDRAEVEKRLVVETSKPVEGAWHWFSSEEIHYRPKTYWPAHTDVTLRINTKDVNAGDGAWGIKDKVRHFTIANSVVTKVDLDNSHKARVYINGDLARSIPVTGGKSGWETRNGTKVVLEKRQNVDFTNEAIGAPEHYRLTGRWALRVTWSGEFLHSAPWSVGSQGYSNTSHGCVGMSLSNSDWLWQVSHVGDPVEVVSSSGAQMPATGNGYGDWNVSWNEWKAGSALS
ncbi:L,D-transpeptidase [Actinopolymorpha pittospori]|uniref:Lipoprotein-anchoring transpeptidase ErfK/SrfK n=1 Tax=Actinopolymorpha pittospori TaxID=648752 RepID=A0A927RG81_9ACTN|nr:Ig-like domain-containing protein [Actinopolymorpha pittospori]MBE1610920.1 lipoprotein-anchoring transpeptidase ErfK/SrfK [Actinopolymorpha pittospori]